jgi:hypothetical protein
MKLLLLISSVCTCHGGELIKPLFATDSPYVILLDDIDLAGFIKFTNTNSFPIKIEKFNLSCDCFTAKLMPENLGSDYIAPGDAGLLELKFHGVPAKPDMMIQYVLNATGETITFDLPLIVQRKQSIRLSAGSLKWHLKDPDFVSQRVQILENTNKSFAVNFRYNQSLIDVKYVEGSNIIEIIPKLRKKQTGYIEVYYKIDNKDSAFTALEYNVQ